MASYTCHLANKTPPLPPGGIYPLCRTICAPAGVHHVVGAARAAAIGRCRPALSDYCAFICIQYSMHYIQYSMHYISTYIRVDVKL